MGENMHCVPFFECKRCIWFLILNWLISVCEYGIILYVRAFRYFCCAWTCTSSKYCEHENLWWWCVTIWIFEYTIDPCISKLSLVVCIHDLVLCSTIWGNPFELLNLSLLEDKQKFKLRSVDESTNWTHLGLYYFRNSVLECLFYLNTRLKCWSFRYLKF